jgi:hypothetical protein
MATTGATAPRRINKVLLSRAEASAALFHRSGTEQLEHWATLGAAIETVLGLKAVARLKTLGLSSEIDSLIANAGTPAANKKLARFLETQAYPQFGASPKDPGKIEIYARGSGKRSRHTGNDTLKP